MFNDVPEILDSMFEALPSDTILVLVLGMSCLSENGLIESPVAKFLHDMKLLEFGYPQNLEFKGEAIQLCCVQLSLRGKLALDAIKNDMGIIPKDKEPGPYLVEHEFLEKKYPLKVLMNEGRLREELSGRSKRARRVLERYDRTFEESLKQRIGVPLSLFMYL